MLDFAILLLLLGGSPLMTSAADSGSPVPRPDLKWRLEMWIDMNCDGAVDRIFSARDQDNYFVAAVVSGETGTKTSLAVFGLRGSSQDSFCAESALLRKERLNYDPSDALGELPEGFKQSDSCFGTVLTAGECDPFHLYWNHQKNELSWWRL